MAQAFGSLLALPFELVQHITSFLEGSDLRSLCSTSRKLHEIWQLAEADARRTGRGQQRLNPFYEQLGHAEPDRQSVVLQVREQVQLSDRKSATTCTVYLHAQASWVFDRLKQTDARTQALVRPKALERAKDLIDKITRLLEEWGLYLPTSSGNVTVCVIIRSFAELGAFEKHWLCEVLWTLPVILNGVDAPLSTEASWWLWVSDKVPEFMPWRVKPLWADSPQDMGFVYERYPAFRYPWQLCSP